jgi:hypothetical protein
MVCYRDRTFCGSPNCKNKCGRQFTDEDHEDALKWWGGAGYPVSLSLFCDENGELIDYGTTTSND